MPLSLKLPEGFMPSYCSRRPPGSMPTYLPTASAGPTLTAASPRRQAEKPPSTAVPAGRSWRQEPLRSSAAAEAHRLKGRGLEDRRGGSWDDLPGRPGHLTADHGGNGSTDVC